MIEAADNRRNYKRSNTVKGHVNNTRVNAKDRSQMSQSELLKMLEVVEDDLYKARDDIKLRENQIDKQKLGKLK